MSESEAFERAVRSRAFPVGVVGLGAVGLQVARALVEAGFHVLGHDVDPVRVAALASGETPLRHLGARHVEALRASGRFDVGTDSAGLSPCGAVLVCVPTPLDLRGEPDLSAVRDATEALARVLAPGALLVLESTAYPGTTREVVGETLLDFGREPGHDVLLAYSPEREDPGRAIDPRAVPKLVGGTCERSTRAALALYREVFTTVVPVSSAEVAEAAKLFENVYRAVNIALANELSDVCTALGLDVREVLDAAATKPFGFQKFTPGAGVGGHCIAVNPAYFAWIARASGERARLVELAARINAERPQKIVERVARALEERGVALESSRVLVLGIAYKPEVDIVAGSPGLAIVELLLAAGADARWSDPHAALARSHALAHARVDVRASADLAGFDAVVLATAHGAFAALEAARHAKVFVDAGNTPSRAPVVLERTPRAGD